MKNTIKIDAKVFLLNFIFINLNTIRNVNVTAKASKLVLEFVAKINGNENIKLKKILIYI